MDTTTKIGYEANQWRKKHVAKEVEEVDHVKMTMKKRKLHRGLFEEQSRPETSEPSSSSGSFYMDQKVYEINSYQDSKGFVMIVPLSPKKALHAANIRIRFADTIVKAKDKKTT